MADFDAWAIRNRVARNPTREELHDCVLRSQNCQIEKITTRIW